jgi:hypothetical protein
MNYLNGTWFSSLANKNYAVPHIIQLTDKERFDFSKSMFSQVVIDNDCLSATTVNGHKYEIKLRDKYNEYAKYKKLYQKLTYQILHHKL